MTNTEVWRGISTEIIIEESGLKVPEFELSEEILPPYNGHRKDPCIVEKPSEQGLEEHIYVSHGALSAVGSAGEGGEERWTIGHYVRPARSLDWIMLPDVQLDMPGEHIAAPSVVFDKGSWLMVVHETFLDNGGNLVIARSDDGHYFYEPTVIVRPDPATGELGLYDPHFMLNCEALGRPKYSVITYSGGVMQKLVPHYVAEVEARMAIYQDNSWQRRGIFLPQDQIPRHNQLGKSEDYEWGSEGTQLFHTGRNLCGVAVRFKDKNHKGKAMPIPRGERQELLLITSITGTLEGPYIDLGIDLYKDFQGEYGHASVQIKDGYLYIYYQYRYTKEVRNDENGQPLYCISQPWNVGVAKLPLEEFDRYVSEVRAHYFAKKAHISS